MVGSPVTVDEWSIAVVGQLRLSSVRDSTKPFTLDAESDPPIGAAMDPEKVEVMGLEPTTSTLRT
jgi:hypothetical protein